MAQDPSKPLSDKIEETIEGALRFVVRFLRTVAVILFHPITCERILLYSRRHDRKFVRPMTFLAIGGFVFALTISVYPKGFLGLINIIWFDEEVSATLAKRWEEALSVSGLVLAAFPVLFTVAVGAGAARRLIASPRRRDEFTALNGYLFGYQSLLLFSGFFFAILQGAVHDLFGVEVKEVLGIENFSLPGFALNALYVGLALISLSALLMPAFGLTVWALRILRNRSSLMRIGMSAALVAYVIAVFPIYSYTASAPAAFKSVTGPKAQKVKIHFTADPAVRGPGEASRSPPTLRFDYDIAIESTPTAAIIATGSQISAGLVLEQKGQPDEFAHSDHLSISADGRDAMGIVLAKSSIGTYRLSGTVTLRSKIWDLMKQKAERPLESNDFGFFVNIRIRQDSETTDRRQWLDVRTLVVAKEE